MDPWILLQYGYWAILGMVLVAVWWFGAQPERLGVSILAIASGLSILVSTPDGRRFYNLEIGIAVVDVVTLFSFVVLAISSQRFWPIWAASFQASDLLTHGAISAMPNSVPKAYGLLQGFWVYPMFVAILLGTYGHQRAVKTAGEWP